MTVNIAQKPRITALYDVDFPRWAEQQARSLREGRSSEIDWENLAEEIESLGRNDRHALESHIEVLIAHLVKCVVQPERRTRSWDRTIKVQRDRIVRLVKRSPSLRRLPGEYFGEAFPRALGLVTNDTGLEGDDLPAMCPFTLEQVLDPEFFPD